MPWTRPPRSSSKRKTRGILKTPLTGLNSEPKMADDLTGVEVDEPAGAAEVEPDDLRELVEDPGVELERRKRTTAGGLRQQRLAGVVALLRVGLLEALDLGLACAARRVAEVVDPDLDVAHHHGRRADGEPDREGHVLLHHLGARRVEDHLGVAVDGGLDLHVLVRTEDRVGDGDVAITGRDAVAAGHRLAGDRQVARAGARRVPSRRRR